LLSFVSGSDGFLLCIFGFFLGLGQLLVWHNSWGSWGSWSSSWGSDFDVSRFGGTFGFDFDVMHLLKLLGTLSFLIKYCLL